MDEAQRRRRRAEMSKEGCARRRAAGRSRHQMRQNVAEAVAALVAPMTAVQVVPV